MGIGNTLLGDEGAGVHAVRALAASFAGRPDIECLDGGTLSFTLAASIENTDRLVVIDAAQLDAVPGSVSLFENEDMDRYLGSHRKGSVHEVGLIDLLVVARLSEALPAKRALIGIQPEFIDWAEAPTPAVAQGIERACALAGELLARWDA
jgi:hydrogenase maturation protease